MRIVSLLGSAAFLGGCVVQQPLPPAPYPLQYAPPISYRTDPLYRPPLPPPQDATEPNAPVPLITPGQAPDNGQAGGTPPGDNGAIPLQDMPAPSGSTAPTDTPSANETNSPTPEQPTRMPSQSSPVAGRGNNVPLEGFRPMRTQTQPTP